MICIKNMEMNTNNLEESIDRLEDDVIRDIIKAFPHIGSMNEVMTKVTMAAIATHLADLTTFEVVSFKKELTRFEVSISLIGKYIGMELNEVIPVNISVLARLYKNAVMFKYRFCLLEETLKNAIIDNEKPFSDDYMKAIEENKATFINALGELK